MKKTVLILCAVGAIVSVAGCETVKKVMGTSIAHLQTARAEAMTMSFDCSFADCFDSVLTLSRNEYMGDSLSGEKPFETFQKDRVRGYVVVMGVAGNIDTTEVGIFFIEMQNGVRIEISSLSTAAKEKVAKAIFRELNLKFNRNP